MSVDMDKTQSGHKDTHSGQAETTPYRLPTERLIEAIKQADQIISLTHDELSKVKMNTLTTKQYIVWKNEKQRLGLADDTGRLTLTTVSESLEEIKPVGFSIKAPAGVPFVEYDDGKGRPLEPVEYHLWKRIAELEAIRKAYENVISNCHKQLADLTAENERLTKEVIDKNISNEWYQLSRQLERELSDTQDEAFIKHRDIEAKLKLATDGLETVSNHEPEGMVCADYAELKDIARETLAKVRSEK